MDNTRARRPLTTMPNDGGSERRRLLADDNDSRRHHYGSIGSIHNDDADHVDAHPGRGMYDTWGVRAVFAIGTVLTLVNTFGLLYLLTLLYHPSLPSPFTTAPLLQTNLHMISLLVLIPSLLILEVSSTATKGIHGASLGLVVVLAILLAALEGFRESGMLLSSLPALGLLAASLIWALVAGRVVEGLSHDYLVLSDEQERVITVASQDAQPRWERWAKVALSVVSTTFVALLIVLLLSNTALDGYDQKLKPPGRRINVVVRHGGKRAQRMHIGVQEPTAKSNLSSGDNSMAPTAVFFPPAGISGYTSSHWLRHMVAAANDTTRDDGHLAPRRLVWFDRFGTGLSDYVRHEEDLQLQAIALRDALQQLNVGVDKDDPLMLVSLHDGHLLSQAFSALITNSSSRLHSRILIDAETAGSYYSTDISPASGLRRGYPRSTLSLVVRDLLSALVSPLSPSRILGAVFLATARRERVLGDRHGVASPDLPRAVYEANNASWNIFTAPANTPYLTLLSHHLDAARGVSSPNYQHLTSLSNTTAVPTAILTSFWKMGVDPQGFGEVVQRQGLVKPAISSSNLVGWWKVGSKLGPRHGGDVGTPEGLCASAAQERVWCEEAVRKALAWRGKRSGGGESDDE